ncbi:MAG TPA: GatB/YqeY domain-containing protein [Candidatus Saccharimonadales bacterium]|nr:GatB/YqeY domain-containing protein [Candidatus Saccharimonadales bacterium]
MLKQQLKDQLKESMMAKDSLRTSVIRFILSGITYYEINKGGAGYEATEEDVMTVINKEVKQRKDSIEQYENAGRQDLADKEKAELSVLETYIPEQMGEEEVRALVHTAVEETGAANPSDIGKVMGALMPKVKGKADGSLVSRLVREALTA